MGCAVSAEEQCATPNGSPAKPTPTGDGQTAEYSTPENPRPPKKKRRKRSERRESATADENDASEAAVVEGESTPTAPRLFSAERPTAVRPQPGPGNDIVDAAASRNLSGSGSKHASASLSSSQSKSSPTWTRTDVRRMTDSTNSNGDVANANPSTDANKLKKKKKRKKSLAPPPAQLGIPAVSVLHPLLASNVQLTEPSALEDRIESPEDDPRRFSGGSIGRTSPGLGRPAQSIGGVIVPDPRNPLATPPGDSPLVERGRDASLLQLLNAVQQRQIKQRSAAVLRRSPCSSTSTRPISSPVPLSQSGSTAFSSSPSNDSPSMDDLLPRGDGNSGETSSNSKEEAGEEEEDEVGVASAPLRPARAQPVDDVEWSVLREGGRGAVPENEPLIGFFRPQ